MEIKGKAKITVGLCRTVAITELSEVWAADGSSSDIIKNEIIEYGSTDFAEDVLGIYLDDPKELKVEFTAKCSFCSDQEVDEIEYTAIELTEVNKGNRGGLSINDFIGIETYEDCPVGVMLVVWTGDDWATEYVDICTDTGTHYPANGVHFTHYSALPCGEDFEGCE